MNPGDSSADETLQALRAAVAASPNNVPLRQHFAETLLGRGLAEDAEKEFRHALGLAPNHPALKLGLARAFHQQGKHSHALVIVEDLTKSPNAPARAFVLLARLLAGSGEVEKAVSAYRRGVELDASAADLEFAARLGIGADEKESEVVEGKVRAAWDEGDDAPVERDVERPKITFNDVGGMEKVKEEIRMKIIHPLTHPELYKAYGKPIGGGILMYGPPGCGKTYLARATAGEINAAFIAVGINDVLDMWIGRSERNLHDFFDRARATAPACSSLTRWTRWAPAAQTCANSAGRQLINQFLAELDGVQSSNEGVLILAATNAPWHLDSAFRRPGRFDRVLFVPPPDAQARAAILRLQCRGKPVAEIDYDPVARKCENFSGADLKAAVDIAIERKLQEAIKTGIASPLTTKDLAAAASAQRPTTKEWFSTARNYALYSNQGGIYDDILQYLKI